MRNGYYPSSKKDVEKIFIEILSQKVNYTINDINNKQLDLPKPTGKYIYMLKEAIEDYIYYYNNKRIKEKLKGLTPASYRSQSLLAS